MADTTNSLPDYAHPPVVETVLGVQFDRLPHFSNAHLGAFWNSLDVDEWPDVADAPPIVPVIERFTEAARWAKGLQLQLTQDPACRMQIRNKDNDRMIQVQNGRLHFNWLGDGGQEYPHYEKVRDGFNWALQRFMEFISQQKKKVGEFRPNQWEVTYINYIPKGTVWSSPDDWNFFQLLSPVPTIENLVQSEGFSGEWHFQMPEERGRLHIAWQHARKTTPEQQDEEFVRLTLTARGPVKRGEVKAIFDGLELGRATIVHSFRFFMNETANKFWGLRP